MKDRLQIRYDSHLYRSAKEVKTAIEKSVFDTTGRWTLKGEPILFYYGDKNNPNVILALGQNGNGVSAHSQNGYFIIDFATLRNDIDEVSGHTGDNIELISGISKTLVNVIESVGLNDDGTFDWHRLDPHDDINHLYPEAVGTDIHHLLKLMIDDIFANKNENLSFDYDDASNTLILKGADDTVIDEFDASIFVKDGLLEKVDIIHNAEEQADRDPDGYNQKVFPYLLFVWNTQSEKSETRIPILDIMNPYVAGNGLKLNGDEFSIKLDEANNENNFLSVDEHGLKLTGVAAAIEAARKDAKTKLELEPHATHLTLTERNEADGSLTYVMGSEDIASASELLTETNERRIADANITQTVTDIRRDLDNEITGRTQLTDILTASATTLAEKSSELERRIQAEENRRLADDNALSTRIDAVLTALTVESGRAVTEETRIAGLVEAERDRSAKVDETISGHVVSLKEQVSTAVSDIDGLKANSVLGVNPSDKMLTITDNLISSTFDVEYDQEHKQIRFIGKNSSILGTVSTSDFVLDGMIDSVSVSTEADEKYLVFVFNTDAGKETIKVKVTDFMKEYSVAEGSEGFISIEDYKIGIKTNTTDNSGIATESQLHDLKDIVGSGFNEPGQEHTLTQKIREIEERLNDTALEEDVEAVKTDVDKIKNVLLVQLKPKAVLPKAEIKLSFSNTPNGTKYIEVGMNAKPIIDSLYTDGKYVMTNGFETSAKNEINQNNTVKSVKRKFNDIVEEINVNNIDENYKVKDGTYSASAVIAYNEGITDPLDVFGDVDETIRIPAGTINCKTEGEIKVYRPIYCGTFNPENYGEINATTIQEMISNRVIAKLQTYSWEEEKKAGRPDYVEIQAGTKAVIIAIPKDDDRFVNGEVKAILDNKDHGFNIKDDFDVHDLKNLRTYDGDTSGYPYVAYVYLPSTEMEESTFKVIY